MATKSARDYVKSTTVHVIAKDGEGFPTNSIEMDRDGQHWHVVAGKEPVAIDADEISSIAAESASGAHQPNNG